MKAYLSHHQIQSMIRAHKSGRLTHPLHVVDSHKHFRHVHLVEIREHAVAVETSVVGQRGCKPPVRTSVEARVVVNATVSYFVLEVATWEDIDVCWRASDVRSLLNTIRSDEVDGSITDLRLESSRDFVIQFWISLSDPIFGKFTFSFTHGQ